MGWGIIRIPIDTWIQSNLQAKLHIILLNLSCYEEKIIRHKKNVQILFNFVKEEKVEAEI